MQILPNFNAQPFVVKGAPKEMLSVTMEQGKRKVRINSSSLSIIQECPRKANYVLNEKWKKKIQNPATLFGSAIHKALEVFYSAPLAERVLPGDYKSVISSLETMEPPHDSLVYRASNAFVQEAEPLRGLDPTNKRSIAAGLWMLGHYFEAYIDDPFVVEHDQHGPMVERAVSFVLHEDEHLIIEYFGTIDLVLKNQNTGTILVGDHKTSSIVGNDFFNRLKPNHQYTGYLMAAKRALHIDTDSFLINGLQVKPKPKTSRGGPPHFFRQVTKRDENDYREFIDTVHHYVNEYLVCYDTSAWPLGHTNACASYGGCQYLEVCSSPKAVRESILQSSFEQEGTNEAQ